MPLAGDKHHKWTRQKCRFEAAGWTTITPNERRNYRGEQKGEKKIYLLNSGVSLKSERLITEKGGRNSLQSAMFVSACHVTEIKKGNELSRQARARKFIMLIGVRYVDR
ncbi:hypothetical protein BaRGS_00026650 [Batillaria attramentaria]|uniref:BRCT domain-containing protein n=1 Tax=Batillaria attramentaria TaxID=370345 RepID=A0ABD0K572_9CAEN